jgi:Fe-S oxidoreductase
LEQRWVHDVMDLCLSCKACKAECPSNVDLAKLKAEFLQAYYDRRPRPLGHLLVKNVDGLLPVGARFAGLSNWLSRRRFARGLLESLAGIDRRRSLPELHRDHLRRWFHRTRNGERGTRNDDPSSVPRSAFPVPRSSVLLLDDCFTTYQEPHIGRSAVTLLERAGYRVELAGVCCGRAMISKGFLTAARQMARSGEPSCLVTLGGAWPELVPGPDARRVAAAAELAEAWVARQAAAGRFPVEFPRLSAKALLHGHCHQKALVGAGGSAAALRLVGGLDVAVLDAGCCGMAGSFGYEKKHYDLSVAIANLALVPAVKADPEAVVVATGTSCRHQIHDLTGRTAVHPVELLAGSTNLG